MRLFRVHRVPWARLALEESMVSQVPKVSRVPLRYLKCCIRSVGPEGIKGEKGDRGLPGLPGQKGDRVSGRARVDSSTRLMDCFDL